MLRIQKRAARIQNKARDSKKSAGFKTELEIHNRAGDSKQSEEDLKKTVIQNRVAIFKREW
jgi:hypothetical protein